MGIAIMPAEITKMREHGRRAYPHECCGVLFGKEVAGWKVVAEARPLENAQETGKAVTWDAGESPRRRFEITVEDFRASERYAREQRLDMLGFYHSHPDHPARPSQHDLERAWPWFSYIILSVKNGDPDEMTSWVLDEDRSKFNAEAVGTAFGTDPAPAGVEEVKQDAG